MFHKPLTIWLPIEEGVAARVQIEVVQAPFGGLDPESRREPTLSEMERIAEAISDRKWSFAKPI
jgi:hypothetical protein